MDRHGLLISALSAGPELLLSLLEQAPPHLLKVRPAPTKWSMHEHAVHLPDVEQRLADRRDHMLGEDMPVIEPWRPTPDLEEGAYLAEDLDEAVARWRRLREKTLDELSVLTPDQWGRRASHPEYAHYSIFTMMRHLLLHEQAHMTRIEELSLDQQHLDRLQTLSEEP